MKLKHCCSIIFFTVCLVNANAQNADKTSVGYLGNYENLPKIKFVQSNEAEYNQYKTVSEPITLKIKENKFNFTLPTKAKKVKFKKTNQEQNDFEGYDYLGYYPKLKMFAVTENSSSENLTFSSFGLVDSLTGHYYSVISIGDGAIEPPIPSLNSKYLVYYYNLAYKANSCFIGLLKVNIDDKPVDHFKETMSFETDRLAVEDIKWIDDKNFIVKTYIKEMKNDSMVKIFSYFKSTIE
ncbi:hypothetical protein [Pedobacter jamesrossensis]|uniref:Uncharacterized protein n=1 Tax=Pedobacter jamesrossensis TaxID=1908238 RepID=A0ABV8NJ09_9SPHI